MDFFFVVKSARPLRCMAHNLCTWICFQSQATPSFWLWVVWLGMRRPMRCLRSCWTLLFRTDMEDTSLQTNTRLTSTPVTSRYEVEGINHPKIILTIFTHPHVIPNTHTKKDVLKNVFVQNNIRPHLLSLIIDTVILLIPKIKTFCSCRVVMTWTPITCWGLVSEQAGASVDSVCRPTAVVEREEPLRSSLWKVHHCSATSVYLKHEKMCCIPICLLSILK